MSRYPLNLPIRLKEEAADLASREGVSLNQFIVWAVAEKVGGLKERIDDPRFPRVRYRTGAAGRPVPYVRGTGIRVQTLAVAHAHWRMSASEIAEGYDLELSAVEEALRFYDAHRAEIDALLEEEERLEQASA